MHSIKGDDRSLSKGQIFFYLLTCLAQKWRNQISMLILLAHHSLVWCGRAELDSISQTSLGSSHNTTQHNTLAVPMYSSKQAKNPQMSDGDWSAVARRLLSPITDQPAPQPQQATSLSWCSSSPGAVDWRIITLLHMKRLPCIQNTAYGYGCSVQYHFWKVTLLSCYQSK